MSTASKAVQLAVTAAKADAAIRAKVRKNSKDRYWTATLRPGYVNIGKPISYAVALNEIRNGRNVFTVTKSEAYKLAKNATGKNPVGPEIDAGKQSVVGYYYHYHRNGRKAGHVWFLFW